MSRSKTRTGAGSHSTIRAVSEIALAILAGVVSVRNGVVLTQKKDGSAMLAMAARALDAAA